MKVIITAAAKNDLREIGAFIHSHHPKRAISFTDELLDRCNGLVETTPADLSEKRCRIFGTFDLDPGSPTGNRLAPVKALQKQTMD